MLMNVRARLRPAPALAPALAHRPGARRDLTCTAIGIALVLAGCASPRPMPPNRAAVAAQWHAPLPHEGQIEDLKHWWAQFNDPLLPHLIEAAQQASPTLALAAANMAVAQASRVGSDAALRPSLDAVASATRARADQATFVTNTSSLGLQASWELDLFGARRAGLTAAQARLASSQAGWHDARVSVAAEMARHYVELRACEAQLEQGRTDHHSRAETARLTALAAAGGLRSSAATDLARASAAQGELALAARQVQCELLVKALVALSGLSEADLRPALSERTAQLPRPAGFGVSRVPAEVLAQRPDLYAAAQDVLAASADASQAGALHWPRITLAGSIGTSRESSLGVSSSGTVWSVGPIAISFPLFDGGTRRASEQAARVRYEAALAVYAARLRTAIQDVEGALITLDSSLHRSEQASQAAKGFERAFLTTHAAYGAGVSSLFDLEDARRSLVEAQSTWIDLRRDQLLAWITLYRHTGGGWSPPAASPPEQRPMERPAAVSTDIPITRATPTSAQHRN